MRQFSVLLRLGLAMALALLPQLAAAQSSWDSVDQALGRPGTTQPDGVRRYSFPRSDLQVQLDGVAIKPALALGSWIAFQPNGHSAVVMGDVVLTADEVTPVMSALLDGGIQVTALHNHFFFDQPKVYFMHIGGMGNVQQLAGGVKKVYDKIADIRAANPTPLKSFPGKIDTPSAITAAEPNSNNTGGITKMTISATTMPVSATAE